MLRPAPLPDRRAYGRGWDHALAVRIKGTYAGAVKLKAVIAAFDHVTPYAADRQWREPVRAAPGQRRYPPSLVRNSTISSPRILMPLGLSATSVLQPAQYQLFLKKPVIVTLHIFIRQDASTMPCPICVCGLASYRAPTELRVASIRSMVLSGGT